MTATLTQQSDERRQRHDAVRAAFGGAAQSWGHVSEIADDMEQGGPVEQHYGHAVRAAHVMVERGQRIIQRVYEARGRDYADVVLHEFIDGSDLAPHVRFRRTGSTREPGVAPYEPLTTEVVVDITDAPHIPKTLYQLIDCGGRDVDVTFRRGAFWSIGERSFVSYGVEVKA